MSHTPTASELGVVVCRACSQVCRGPAPAGAHCPRCGTALHRRIPHSLARTWALLLAAALLYAPANLLPMMRTSQLFSAREDTIVSGVIALWNDGAWALAVIVFIASVVVPLVKIAVLTLLLLSAQRGSHRHQRDRARLYRLIELVGHWSMLDVFVMALLITLVHFKTFANVEAGSGAIAFGAVVVLTMLATMSFDPRLIWDTQEEPQA